MFEKLSKNLMHDNGKRVVRCENCETLLVSVDGATEEELTSIRCPECGTIGSLTHKELGNIKGCIREKHKDRLGVYPISNCTWCSNYLGVGEHNCRFYKDKHKCEEQYLQQVGEYTHDCKMCDATGLVHIDIDDYGICPECSGFGFTSSKQGPSTFKGLVINAGVSRVGLVSAETLVTAKPLKDYTANDMCTVPVSYTDFLNRNPIPVDMFTLCPREVYLGLELEELDGVCPHNINPDLVVNCSNCNEYHNRTLCWKSYNIKNKWMVKKY